MILKPMLLSLVIFTNGFSYVVSSCGSWKVGTLSGYDNLDGADDKHPGSIAEYSGTTTNFLNNVPVASILMNDWSKDKYHNIEMKYKGQTKTVQSWDQCADADCGKNDLQCCTRNAKKFANPGYLLDIDKQTLSRLFGIKNYEETLEKIQYRICDKFDPTPIAKKYNLHK